MHASVQLVIGVRVTREELFTQGMPEYRCDNGHKRRPSEAFCSQCGSRVQPRETFVPKPGLVAYAQKYGLSPGDLWEPSTTVGAHCVDPIQWPEKPGEAFAFGEIVDDVEVDDCSGPACEALVNLAAAKRRILAAAKELGLAEPHFVEVFACACLSS